jgi:diaminopimelate decarboxylase
MSTPVNTLPGQPHVARRDGELWMEGVSLASLAREHGTPLFAYSRQWMLDALAAYQRGFEGRDALICYAMKANSSLGILRVFAQAGCGFDIVSGGELARVLAVGADPAKIIFSGVGKTRAEMRAALETGIFQLNVESIPELEALSEVASSVGSTASIAIRVNPDVDARTHAKIATGKKENKFGIDIDHARATYARAAKLPGIKAVAVAVHIGSQLTSLEPFRAAFERVV